MNWVRSLVLLLPILLQQATPVAPPSKPAIDPFVAAVMKEEKENPQVMEILDHLTNKIGPRLTSSDNLTKACEWARDQFKAWGYDARLEEWGTFPVGFNRKPWSGRMLHPEELKLEFGFNSWSPGTNGPVRGAALLAPTDEEGLDRIKPKLKGAWIFSKKKTTSRELADKITAAYAEAGIAGIVRPSEGELIHTAGNYKISMDALPTRVNVTLLQKQHEKIMELLKKDEKVAVEFDIPVEFKPGPVKLYDVVADLKGTEKPDEFVIVGGHIDSWDGATGTTDNGTGAATTLEVARLIAKSGFKPKRTLRFMLFSGEEQGLLGSVNWIPQHRDELPKISAVLVHDMGTNYVCGISATAPMVPIFEKVFAPVIGWNEAMPFEIKKVGGLPFGIGSDHDTFLRHGVPGFFWLQKGKQDYGHEHHTQFDVYASAVPEYQRHSSVVISVGAMGIANFEKLIPREGLSGKPSADDDEESKRRRLGVQLGDDLKVDNVVEGSPAEKAGLKEGDTILKIGDIVVADQKELRDALPKLPKTSTVTVARGGKELVLKVEFDR